MDPLTHAVPRRSFLVAGLWFLLFVVYGSLVPLDFRPMPLDTAWANFQNIRYLNLGLGSRADWIANILLYMPLGFCFAAAFGGGSTRTRTGDFIAGLVVFVLCAAVAVAVEFTQQFFPPRTVSQNDLLAEAMGSAAGIGVWWAAGGKLVRLAGGMALGGPRAIRAAATVYVLAYLGLSLFPFDFVVTSAELRWKLDGGSYDWFLVRGDCGGLVTCGVKLGAEAAAAIPIGLLMGMLLSRGYRRPYSTALATGVGLGVVIEVAQFFVASGISQGISILTRGLGLVLGTAAYREATPDRLHRLRAYLRPAVLLAAGPYVLTLMALNGWFAARWGGFDFARSSLAEVRFLPFYFHYYTTETNALRSLLAILGIYLPVGIGYWAWYTASRGGSGGSPGSAAALAAALALVMETGKLFVPGHRPDPTDVLIAGFAAYAACAIAAAVLRWAGEESRTLSQPPPVPVPVPVPPRVAPSQPASVQFKASGVARGFSLMFAAAAMAFVVVYPFGVWLAAFLVVYAACLWRWPQAAVPAVLALLPLLDLAPWSGWFYFDEFDALLLVTVAVTLWRIPPGQWSPRRAGVPAWLLCLVAASYAISALIGLLPLQPIDLNAFASYYGHYNALRMFKGFFWALLLAGPAIHLLRAGAAGQSALTAGMLLGLSGVCAVAVWERVLFPGLWNFSNEYRITALFSGMHVGGAIIEGYLILAIPFLAACLQLKRGPLVFAYVVALFILASYVLLVTFARGGYLGYAGVICILGISALIHILKNRQRARAVLIPVLLLAMVSVMAVPLLGGTYMQSRWSAVRHDAEVRVRQWGDSAAIMDEGPVTALFGMGLGRFPETYFFRNPAGRMPATYRYVREDGNVYLSLGAGENLFIGQRVAVRAGRAYVLEFDARSVSPGADLTMGLCEKSILYSFDCQWFTLPAAANTGWTHHRVEINSREIAKGPWLTRRPADLAFANPRAGTLVDLDNVQLLDVAQSRNLVRNGDFSHGQDFWFFTPDDHHPWHVFNLAVAIFFEQGGFGLLAVGLAVMYGLARLGQGVARGDRFSGVLLAALGGFLLVGLFDSLFDAPRLTLLFFLLLFCATARPWAEEARYTTPALNRS